MTHARTDRIFPVLLATVGLAQACPNDDYAMMIPNKFVY